MSIFSREFSIPEGLTQRKTEKMGAVNEFISLSILGMCILHSCTDDQSHALFETSLESILSRICCKLGASRSQTCWRGMSHPAWVPSCSHCNLALGCRERKLSLGMKAAQGPGAGRQKVLTFSESGTRACSDGKTTPPQEGCCLRPLCWVVELKHLLYIPVDGTEPVLSNTQGEYSLQHFHGVQTGLESQILCAPALTAQVLFSFVASSTGRCVFFVEASVGWTS